MLARTAGSARSAANVGSRIEPPAAQILDHRNVEPSPERHEILDARAVR